MTHINSHFGCLDWLVPYGTIQQTPYGYLNLIEVLEVDTFPGKTILQVGTVQGMPTLVYASSDAENVIIAQWRTCSDTYCVYVSDNFSKLLEILHSMPIPFAPNQKVFNLLREHGNVIMACAFKDWFTSQVPQLSLACV